MPSIKENKLRIFLVPFYFIFQVLNTFSLVIKEKPDIIYAHWFTPQAISAYLAKLFFKIPYVFTTHAQDVIVLKKIPILGKLIAKLVIKKKTITPPLILRSELKIVILESINVPINTHIAKEK